MSRPSVTIYITSLTSAVKVRSQIELLERSLRGLSIPFTAYDLSMDEDAKRTWHRERKDGAGLPGYLVDGQWVGSMDDFEYAVETGSLPKLLKQDSFSISDPVVTSSALGTELDGFLANMGDAQAQQLLVELDLIDQNKLEKFGQVELKEPAQPDHQPVHDVLQGGAGFVSKESDALLAQDSPIAEDVDQTKLLDTEEQVKELVREVEGR